MSMDDLDAVAVVVSLLAWDSPGDSNDDVGSRLLFFFFFFLFFLAAVLLGEGVAAGVVGRCCFSLLLRFYIFEKVCHTIYDTYM